MAALLVSADDATIRAYVGAGLSTTDLPNATIELFFNRATRWVLERDPDAESRTGTELEAAQEAARLACAAFIVPRVSGRVVTSFREGQSAASYDASGAVSASSAQADLFAQAEAELATYLGETLPTLFDVAAGTRGR